MNESFAELLGMHAGDGTIYRVSRSLVWELRGGLDEKEFYNNHVVSLIKKATSFSLIPKFRSGGKNGCYGVRCCKKDFINLLLDAGFKPGSKVKTVSIPKIILSSSLKLKSAFLRGLFATDGTFYLARINGNLKPTYPMIELASASELLIKQVKQLLLEFDLNSYSWTWTSKKGFTAYYLRLAGKTKTNSFLEKIGFSNYKWGKIIQKL